MLASTALTSCSSSDSGDDSGKPITKALGQGDITQALPGSGDGLPGWDPYHGKGVTSDGTYCTATKHDGEKETSPKGWVRGGSTTFIYNGSTDNMMDIDVCEYDTPENAKSGYAAWKGTETKKEQAPKKKLGDESVLLINPGLSEDEAEGYVLSGVVNIRIRLDGAAQDTAGVEDMLATTLKRLQQVQDGKRATATAAEQSGKKQ
ncbi:hypothetical protein ACT1U9_30920 [Streptomyces sp. BR1]|uniref:hypothetical protein n=1 Tax=Streptomyces sp. BR1 TaxID=1592323 RepID=UPI00402B6898